MIIIPIHIFLDDKPTNIPKILDEKYFGIKRRNIQNAINKKTALSEASKKRSYQKLSSFCDEIPGLRMVSSEEEFSETLSTQNRMKPLDCIQDDYSQYYLQTVREVFELDAYLENEVEKIKLQPSENQIDSFKEMLLDSSFPGTMLKDNWFDGADDEVQNIQITLRRIMVDSLFYILSAYDVEYNHHFLKHLYGDKPHFLKYLPFYEGNTLQNPSRLWLDRLKILSGYKRIDDFATVIPILGASPKKDHIDSQRRMMRKWREGKDKQLPSWENVNSILEVVIKLNNLDEDDIEMYKEQGRYMYAHAKIFQILLNRLMVENSLELFGMDSKDVIEFFERYLYWHNYHSVMFAEQSINTSPVD